MRHTLAVESLPLWMEGPIGWSLAIAFGLFALVWGADAFIENAARLGTQFGVSKVVIGLLVVAFGTSAPELVVSIDASLHGDGGLGVGNAVGSNIANIGLILGLSLLVRSVRVDPKFVRFQFPILMLVTVAVGFVLYDAKVDLLDGLLLTAGFCGFIFSSLQRREDNVTQGVEEKTSESKKSLGLIVLFLVGLVVLLGGSRALVWGATGAATRLGVDSTIIGLSIVALGTSLPELAASLTAIKKGEDELAIGNVVGSNLFNMLTVLAVPGLISPVSLPEEVFFRDYATMFGLSLMLVVFGAWKGQTLRRWQGVVFVLIFVAYIISLFAFGAV